MNDRKVMTVREVMSADVHWIDSMRTVAEALREMLSVKTSVLMVNKSHDYDEWGMILVSHIARQVLSKERSPERINVYEIMQKPIIKVEAEMDIRYCASLFAHHSLTRAPVVENGEVIGMVSPVNLVLDGLGSMV
ncbi:MAG: CBS domain-containing protein [Immundisolibacteraceae bacterium]|nr:CBS domain-containing protein [Immundisolibacteraceae bacterium]